MKRTFTLGVMASFIFLAGCSKDFLKSYDKRIIGVWRITDVDRVGFGNTDNLPFQGGSFTFYDNGALSYVSPANVRFQGTWDIVKKTRDDDQVHTLLLTAVDYTGQQVLTQYYDEMSFTGTNHFKAKIISTFHTYVTDFKR